MRGSESSVVQVVARKTLAALAVVAFAATLALSGCAGGSADSAGSKASGEAQGAAVIQATVVLAEYPDADFAAQEIAVEVPEGATAFDALIASGVEVVASDSEYGKFVESVAGLEGTGSSGWVFTVNGEQVMESCDSLVLAAGDTVEWSYTTW